MSTVESYGAGNDGAGNNLVPTMRSPFIPEGGVYKPVMPPTPPHSATAEPINFYPGGGNGDASAVAPTINAATGEQTKRKRGRPRKYGVDGSNYSVDGPISAPLFRPQSESSIPASAFSPPAGTPTPGKKRGRPSGSGRKQSVAPMGSPGVGGFTPQLITVQAGEDVSSKILSYAQNGSRAICVLSANGAISNVTLHQTSSTGGTVTYEGRFEIVSLNGSYMVLESGGQRSRVGGLSVSLAGPDGRVLGGGVAGLLIAASPVQVVVGGFTLGMDSRSPNRVDNSAGPPKPTLGSPTESSGSPINQSNDSNPHSMGVIPWN